VRGLTQLLQHPLRVASRPGRGSVFRLALPRIAETNPLPADPPPPVSISQPLPRAAVLLIEDDDIVRSSMVMLLQSWGCQCMAAESLEAALPLLAQQTPALLISDYRLREKKSGTDAIRAIRKAIGRDIPALLLTGDTAPARLREASDSGLPLLHKPVAPALLYDSLNQLLSQQPCTSPGGIQ